MSALDRPVHWENVYATKDENSVSWFEGSPTVSSNEAEVDPARVIICHCTDCQTLSGSAFRTVAQAEPGPFKLLSGAPKAYVKTGDSGNKREQTFCPECGTPIYSAPAGTDLKAVGVRVGTILQRDQLIPRDQYWFRSSQAWLRNLATISKRDEQPVFDAKGAFGR